MKNYRTRKELKKDVKRLFKKDLEKVLLLYMIPILFFVVLTFYERVSFNNLSVIYDYNYFMFNILKKSFFLLIIGLLYLVLQQSVYFRSLDWLRDPELDFSPIKSNFTYYRNPDWWRIIVISFIKGFFTYLWLLLLVIPGCIKVLSYSQTMYVYKDIQARGDGDKYTFTDYITKSRQLMDGNKWRYFVLQLSYIGWFLLGSITFGIAYIWVIPYISMTNANFYKDLVEQNPEIV